MSDDNNYTGTYKWQPIETAPTDGTYVIVYPGMFTSVGISIATYDTDQYAKNPRPYWRRIECMRITDSRNKQPTHWMPQPTSPDPISVDKVTK